MKDIITDPSWKKTVQLIEEKYGKHIEFRSLKMINSSNTIKPYQEGDDLVIPLRLRNHDLGDIIVDRGSFLNEQQQVEIIDLVKFLIEPQIYNIHLKSTEQNLEIASHRQNSPHDNNDNVVQIFGHHDEPTMKLLSNVIHLKSHTEQNRVKVAMKIHEMSGRNLFVHIEDIINSISEIEDLKSLNDTTIFISHIEQISYKAQNLLELYLTGQTSTTTGPIVLIGSSLSMDSVQAQNWKQSFKNDLLGFYFDIDRIPMAQQTSEEILELLFFHTDQESL